MPEGPSRHHAPVLVVHEEARDGPPCGWREYAWKRNVTRDAALEVSLGGAKQHLKLRVVTLKFFERGLGSLALLRKAMVDFPDSVQARQCWIREIRLFAERAH
jgi:hypothetical protein